MTQPNQTQGYMPGEAVVNLRGLAVMGDLAQEEFGKLFTELTITDAVHVLGTAALGAHTLDPKAKVIVRGLKQERGVYAEPIETADAVPRVGYQVPEGGLIVSVVRNRTLWEAVRRKKPETLFGISFPSITEPEA